MKFNPPPQQMDRARFVACYGGVYEHSPWIAEAAWERGIHEKHAQLDTLASLLAGIVDQASEQQQLDLILAHPDLAGKAAQAGELTEASSSEQAGAGIDQCSAEEFELFQKLNQAYRDKFNFPFIMAVKGANRQQILAAFEQRLPNSYTNEFAQALQQIHKIARFRLEEIARTVA